MWLQSSIGNQGFQETPYTDGSKFVEARKDKALRCEETFFEYRAKTILLDGLPLNVGDNMCMYWVARLTMHLRQLAQYTDTPL